MSTMMVSIVGEFTTSRGLPPDALLLARPIAIGKRLTGSNLILHFADNSFHYIFSPCTGHYWLTINQSGCGGSWW